MAQVTFSIPDAYLARAVTAHAGLYGQRYQLGQQIPNPAFDPAKPADPATNPKTIMNPLTPQDLLGKVVMKFVADNTAAWEKQQSVSAAGQQADTTFAQTTDLTQVGITVQ